MTPVRLGARFIIWIAAPTTHFDHESSRFLMTQEEGGSKYLHGGQFGAVLVLWQ